jgi:lysine decarboxylase
MLQPFKVTHERDQNATPYASAIESYIEQDWLYLDVPGHQADGQAHPRLAEYFGERVLRLDLPPLVDGIDYGDQPTPLAQAADLAAEAWGARKTYFLTNGASKGNLVTCLALRSIGKRVLVQRSVHSSVIDGLALAGLNATFIRPSIDADLGIAHGISPQQLRDALDEHADVSAVYVVTPSYFGAVSDVAALAEVAHAAGIALIVDEAWGAHFGFHQGLPTNALRLGADIVISSTHKLAGSLTQSAMLHLADGPFAERLEPLLDRSFRSLQSTSASALLMASLDIARHEIVMYGPQTIPHSLKAAADIRAGITAVGRFRDASDQISAADDVLLIDPLRIVIDTRTGGLSGHEARARLFSEHHVHLEMSTDSVVVAVIGAGAAPDVDRFLAAVHSLPDLGYERTPGQTLPKPGPRAMSIRRAYFASAETVCAKDAIGRVSAETLAAYPPGIPNLIAGEMITQEVVDFLQTTVAAPFGHVRGGISRDVSELRVVK